MSQLLRQKHAKGEGQTTYEMANLRQKTTGLPFVVWVSQRAGARHDARVMVAYNARTLPALMGTYAIRPFAFVAGQQLHRVDEKLLEEWIEKNRDALIGFWDADIEFTEDLIDQLQKP
jgi:hypothetical protein